MKRFIFISLLAIVACNDSNIVEKPIINVELGDTYQGGVVFHIFDETHPDYVEGEQHGYIFANPIGAYPWGCTEAPYGLFNGSGDNNSDVIVEYCSNDNSAYNCLILTTGGYFDWWLPSAQEFELLYTSQLWLNDEFYWTSSKNTSNTAIIMHPVSGSAATLHVNASMKSIPIRQF